MLSSRLPYSHRSNLCVGIVEEKYGKLSAPQKRKRRGNDGDEAEVSVSDGSSSESEDEDDEGDLVTEALDAEISATLQAIRARDPRVYDGSTTFYAQVNEDGEIVQGSEKKEKPMYLRDYHRKNLLEGINGENGIEDLPKTYVQDQEDLKRTIVTEMHAAVDNKHSGSVAEDDSSEAEDDEDGGFLIPKSTPVTAGGTGGNPPKNSPLANLDVEKADQDPERFLSKFMSARAWVPTPSSRFQPFESDDEEEDRKADAFEEAYNFRFEDPTRANEKLLSHARDAAAKYSVRREEPNSRKKVRDMQRAKKDAEKNEREEEIARLRRLKIEEIAEKVRKIKEAAGLGREAVSEEVWANFIETDWDNDRWEEEMAERFGTSYYADQDAEVEEDGESTLAKKRKKMKKPKWDEDIDIKDLIPDFQDEEDAEKPPFTLSDEELNSDDANDPAVNGIALDEAPDRRKKANSDKTRRMQEKLDRKKGVRKERRRIEQIVDEKVNFENTALPARSKHAGQFRYRETSPLTYGLTARDILMASDSQLNQYAGLKKMAAFRDAEKKKKDKKRLGKKARLRQWRKETFGDEEGPQQNISDFVPSQVQRSTSMQANGDTAVDIHEGPKKKKRSRKSKSKTAET